jgi:Concanavalin A-like lectin/glucanases superfamily/Regulator of chromosome condensation (RCC1) repeat/Secretion system C-terminal sorting domain
MTNRQLYSTPSVKHLILRGCLILFLSFCLKQAAAQNPTLTTTDITICGGSLDLNSLITTNGTSVTWSEKPQATAIDAGFVHSLALLSNGTVVGWGDNSFAQMMIPSFSSIPTAIAAGDLHNLALLSNGTVVGWGNNSDGQTTSPSFTSRPTIIAAGGSHSLALLTKASVLSSNKVVGWGDDFFGQASIQSFASRPTVIAAGGLHSLALLSDGTVVGWGRNLEGQTTIPSFAATPTAISAGSYHNLALLSNSTVVGWGENLEGQTTIPSFAATPTAIAAGAGYSLALLSNGTVVGWGDNSSGQTTIPSFATNPIAIAAGDLHSLALLSNGSVVGWGDNSNGQTNGYNALPLSNTTVSPTSTKTYYVVVRNANGGKSTGSVTVTLQLSLPATTTNNALTFDGTNDYALANDCGSTPLINGGSAITVEYWFKGTSLQSAVRTQNNQGFMVAGWNGKHILSNDGGVAGGVSVGAAATDGSWHHVAFTWQQGATNGFKSYLDGSLVEQKNAANVALPVINALLYLGALNGTSEFMNGSLDEVRVWTVARTQAQIQASALNCNPATPQSGLLVYYKFDHGTASGTNPDLISFVNSANNANLNGVVFNFAMTGTSSNVTTGYDMPIPATTTNNALNFDGVNDAVEITNCGSNALTNTDALTIEYWFKGASNHSAVRLQPDNTSYIIAGYISGATSLHLVRLNNVPYSVATGNATDGNWHHVAMTWQRNTTNGFKSYLDGVLVAQTNTPDVALPIITSGIWLGSRSGLAEFTNGSIDEVRVWSTARTQTQIQDNRLGCTNLSGASGLVVYYQFNHGAADGDNSGVATLANSANASTFPAILRNFTRTGSTSNWTASPLCTDTYTWTGAASTDWANLSNWSPTVVPINTSSLTIPTTTNKLTLTGNQTVGQVTLSGTGKIILGNNNLIANNINGGSSNAYVVTNGTGSLTLKDIGTTTTLFPVGPSETIYAPATITNNVNSDFTVSVGTDITNAAALTKTVGLQWNITPSVLTGNSATLGLGWTTASQGSAFNPNTAIEVAHYNGTMWDIFRLATRTGVGTPVSPYVATVTGVNAFSPFVVANQNALSVELLDFKGTPQYNGNLLTWTTASEVNNKGFNVERIMANGQWGTLGFVKSTSSRLQTSTTLNATYDFTDNQPLGVSYYRLRQMDNDGKETLSKVISVSTKGKTTLKVYPSVTTGILTVETDVDATFQVINLLGQEVLRSVKTSSRFQTSTTLIDVSALPKGAYILKVGDEQVKFIKQ